MHPYPQDTRVVIPVKSFGLAKGRLASALTVDQRGSLSRMMAENVIVSATGFDTAVACDDDEVAAWALAQGVEVIRTDELDLDGAATESVRVSRIGGWRRVAVVHADLPLADSLREVIEGTAAEVLVVPDRHGVGTNVIVVPTDRPFNFRFGPDSLRRHCMAAEESSIPIRVVRSESFSWDVDEPGDLVIPGTLGHRPRGRENFVKLGLLEFPGSESISISNRGEHSSSTVSTSTVGVQCK